jgi:plasmid stabilization system protein ParE
MTYRVVVQPRAERDIQLAAHWILGQSGSRATAVRWARTVRYIFAREPICRRMRPTLQGFYIENSRKTQKMRMRSFFSWSLANASFFGGKIRDWKVRVAIMN